MIAVNERQLLRHLVADAQIRSNSLDRSQKQNAVGTAAHSGSESRVAPGSSQCLPRGGPCWRRECRADRHREPKLPAFELVSLEFVQNGLLLIGQEVDGRIEVQRTALCNRFAAGRTRIPV